MYRWFLSWRYLVTRRTNFIGIVGITVAVGALIMILSIMTGFLVEARAMLRGSLSDVIVTPAMFGRGEHGETVPQTPHAALELIRADERVSAATARLTWWGLLAGAGSSAQRSAAYLSDSQAEGLNAVQLIGVDVTTREQFALFGASVVLRALGIPWRAPVLEGEFDTTELLADLEREPHPWRRGAPVAEPRLPFDPPPSAPRAGRRLASVLVGEQLFSRLGLRQGGELKVLTVVPDPVTGELVTSDRDYLVAGTFRSGENGVDIGRIYLDRRELWDLLGRRHTYSEILVKLKDFERDGAAVQRDLVRELGAASLIIPVDFDPRTAADQVRTWEDFRRVMLSAIENERVLLGIMLSLILVVASFTIFAILTMMVTEKRRDIGILTAVGASPRGLLFTFLTIGFWNALLGTGFGALFGILGASYINEIERFLSGALGIEIFNRNVYIFDTIPAVLDPLAIAAIVSGAFGITLLFAAIPAWRAARLDPIVALRYE